jgi:hypothetical protein
MQGELQLLNKGLKYNLHYKQTLQLNISFKAQTAINKPDPLHLHFWKT